MLAIVGSHGCEVNRALQQVRADMLSCGITVNIFDSLPGVPPYRDRQTVRTPRQVVTLRNAADDADAVLVATNYYNRLPSIVHNAIDWLTRGHRSGLSDKPLAVIGRAAKCYSGVWSHCPTDEAGRTGQAPVIESISVATLHDVVRILAEEVEARATGSLTSGAGTAGSGHLGS
ncbi:MAG TPA: NAD(P)H-dependent oxidoreductase [Mycobacterium sp.]|nr:NAD(P)H-dependent oxidoreductase [Mycobacterium sp.]